MNWHRSNSISFCGIDLAAVVFLLSSAVAVDVMAIIIFVAVVFVVTFTEILESI